MAVRCASNGLGADGARSRRAAGRFDDGERAVQSAQAADELAVRLDGNGQVTAGFD